MKTFLTSLKAVPATAPSLKPGVLLLALLLAGCGGQTQELDQWMAEVRKEMRPIDTSVTEPKRFEPYLYAEKGSLDPFDVAKVNDALSKLAARSRSPLTPNLDRRREPLEAFPLDTIVMVGTLERPKLRQALLRANGVLYTVRVGNYVGQNFGIIRSITDSQVSLREVVQDAAGEWVERVSTLELQEKK